MIAFGALDCLCDCFFVHIPDVSADCSFVSDGQIHNTAGGVTWAEELQDT